jgi:hypothetical protein
VEIDLLHRAGVTNADDFTFLSPLNLCLSTGIAPETIVSFYRWAEMIEKVHKQQTQCIVELKAWPEMDLYSDTYGILQRLVAMATCVEHTVSQALFSI